MKIIPVFCLFLIPAVMIAGPGRALEPQVATLARSGDPVVRVTPAQAQRFGDALGAMARQARVTFVAEAEPFKTTLTKQQAAEILPSGSLAQMVSQVANAYDYTATRRDRVFRLTKRYTNPDDLPCVTLEEAKLTADDLLRHLDMVSPRFRAGMVENDKPFADFLASLSQSQLAMMKEETLPVASLSLQQQFQVRRLANFFYVQLFAEGPTTESLRRLNNALKPDATLCWQTVVKQRAFGLAHLDSTDKKSFFPLTAVRGFYTSGMPFTQYGSGPLVDPTDPKPGDRENVPSGSTLGEIARTLNARFGGSPRLLIDHALVAKSITVAGAEFVPALNVLEACAEVYGLRIAREEEGRTLRVTRRRIRRPANIAQLNETMRQALPDPLLRALHRDDRDRARAEVREWAEKKRQDFFRRQAQASASGQSTNNSVPLPEPPPLTPKEAEREQERNQRVRQWQKAPTALRVAAIRRFRATVEPKVKAAPNQELPVADLDTAENAALATALMYSCLDGLKVVLARELPDYLTRFDELIITGGPTLNEDKEMKFGLGLALPLYGGKNLDIQVGVGNLPLPKR